MHYPPSALPALPKASSGISQGLLLARQLSDRSASSEEAQRHGRSFISGGLAISPRWRKKAIVLAVQLARRTLRAGVEVV